MKIADVRYNGPMRSTHRHGPSGETYYLQRIQGQPATEWVPVYQVEDAARFDRTDSLEVRWTSVGALIREVGVPIREIGAHMKDLSYRQKQKVAKALGVKANKPESELEAAVMEAADALIQQQNK